ncbi:filamentous hemagglutinin N-terminal domain-containing protein [Solimonas sp. K1W22B-7]|uniref:filamentous haemagglutinin family protein n=1 Tax=Solimonas sp. K1W22B-7 TaxID=2303331 RepID=UPI000E32FDD9|nr:filamentous haemagglutinin family protein [Solimonas sp. K1W22B-7]AXQ30353.1 filamentous hemagglutinin N-terminal domain-containing protein [Solimonas sp. K1W22B-7]
MTRPQNLTNPRDPVWRLSAGGQLRRLALLSVIGMPALVSAPAVQAGAGFGSPQYFNAARAAQAAQPSAPTPGSPTQPTLPNGASSPQAAAERAQRSIRSLQTSLQKIDAEMVRQRAAALNPQYQGGVVPDGMAAGGLVPAIEAAAQAGNANACLTASQCLWVNAELPTESVAQGKTTVEVKQTAEKAILTWETFNIGANTTLHIDQREGTQADGQNDWVALNRVKAGVQPSVVQGAIKAEGAVYIINQNGILFDGGSVVDTHSLVASTLPLYLRDGSQGLRQSSAADLDFSNKLFLTSGLTSQAPGTAQGSVLGLSQRSGSALLSIASEELLDEALPGSIVVAAGARLSVKDEGFGLLAAPNIRIDGTVEGKDSQLALVAGVGVQLQRATASGSRYTVASAGRITDASQGNADITPVFSIENNGLISSQRGGVSLIGTRIEQDGVIQATTSVSRQGFIDLKASDSTELQRRNGLVSFSGDSLTTILPDADKSQTNSSASADEQFKPLGVTVGGAAIVLDSGAMIVAPGHSVSLQAVAEDSGTVVPVVDPDEGVAGRVYIAPDATIDVAGLADVFVPLANVLITVPRLGLNELADSPLQRDGVLFRAPIVFDSRDFGTREDGVQWVGTPLANLAGYVEQVSRGVRELLTDGGSIKLVGNEVIADQGSALNLAGGYLRYGSGMSNATRLVTASGSIVDIADADPNVRYVGFAGHTIERHERWNINDTYRDPVLAAGSATVFEPEDIAGGRGGTLTVFGQTTSLIAADVDAHAVSGRRQVKSGQPTIGGTLQFGGNFLSQIFPDQPNAAAGPSFVVVESLDPSLLRGVDATSDVFERGGDAADLADPAWWTPVDASMVRESGASVLRVYGDLPDAGTMGGEVRVVDGAQVQVTPGGRATGDNGASISGAVIELVGSRVSIDGDLTAPAGRISITATGRTFLDGSTTQEDEGPVTGDIAVSGDSTLSVRGQFVNDAGLGDDEATGATYINGGSISLRTLQSSLLTDPGQEEQDVDGDGVIDLPAIPPTVQNLTGSILLDSGSVLDAISGVRVAPNGKVQRTGDNVVRGVGGAIELATYVVNGTAFGRNLELATPTELLDGVGSIELGATLLGYGFERGGRLSLRAPGILIDGSSGSDAQGFLGLDPALFSAGGFDGQGNLTTGGFSAFRLDGVFDATVAAGMEVVVSQRNLVIRNFGPGAPDLLPYGPTGTDLEDAVKAGIVGVGQLDEMHRRPVSFELYSGDYLNWVAGERNGLLVPPDLSDFGVTGTTLVDEGASILADARSRVVLGSHNQVTLLGSIVSHGGDVTLTVDTARGGYLNNPGVIANPYTSNNKSVFLGVDSLIDVSGTRLLDTSSVPAGSTDIPIGDVIDGGSVTLSADTGYIVARNCADTGDCEDSADAAAKAVAAAGDNVPKFGDNTGGSGGTPDDDDENPARGNHGARINISGSSGIVGLLAPCPRIEEATLLYSDAGRLRIGAGSGLYFNGIIDARGGGSTSQGGSLAVTPLNPLAEPENGYVGARRMTLAALSVGVPELFQEPGGNVTTAPRGVIAFATDVLKGSGIETLSLGSDPSLSKEPVPIDIISSLDLNLGRALQINTMQLTARPAVPDTGRMKPIEVNLAATYVAIHGYSEDIGVYNDFEDILAPGLAETRQPLSELTIDSRILDIGGQMAIENFKDVSMTGREDIRFLTPPQYSSFATGGSGEYSSLPGVLLVGGNLTMTASRIYPATGQTQIIIADNHLRRSDLELVIKPTQRDPDTGEPLTTLATIYEPSTAVVRFERIAGATSGDKPLSVGGRLIVTAVDILQNGALYAPGGQIQLGIAGDEILEGVNDDSQVFNYDLLPYFRFALPTVTLDNAYHYELRAGETAADSYEDLVFADPDDTGDITAYDGPVKTQAGIETITRKVQFGANSLTSVSLAGLVVPYGRTVDGLNLVYNGTGDYKASVDDLAQSPNKRIGAVGANVDVKDGARIDISGGGDLLATEFVAGTGGSRDVLSTTNVSFTGGEERLASLYPDGRDVYAIVPGYDGVAPFDPEFTRRDPDGAGGTQISASESTRAPLVGRAVFLSGIPGLPEGVYTLLPGAYANLPGAFRLVQDTRAGAQDVIASTTNQKLPDGTLQVAGHYTDNLSGARDAHTTTFLVQSRPVWSQYSQYDVSSLNSYFTAQEAASERALRAPADGGTLALAGVNRLTLDGSIIGKAPQGFSGPELQLSAPRIQIVDSGDAGAGILTLDVDRLNALGASRLLLGATGGPTDDGIEELYVGADTVVAANSTALRAGEIVLVASGDSSGDGVVVQQGARLVADGTATGRRGNEISIGGEGTRQHQALDPDDPASGAVIDIDPDEANVSGNGGFLRLSADRQVTPGRNVVSGIDGPEDEVAFGAVTIGAGALLSGSGSVSLDATGGVILASSADIEGNAFSASTRNITLSAGDAASGAGDLLLGSTLLQQLAGINEVYLQASEGVTLLGDVDLRARQLVEIIGGQVISDGGDAVIEAGRVVFSNQQGAFAYGAGGLGTMTVKADEIELLGDRSTPGSSFGFDGFGQIDLQARRAVLAAGKGTLLFGGANLTLDTPVFGTVAGADLALSDISRLQGRGAQANPAGSASEGLGGSVSLEADSIDWNTTARASAGSIRFDAGGDILLGAAARLEAGGAVFSAYDRKVALAAGQIELHSGQGQVQLGAGSRLDVSAGAAGGDAGQIILRSDASSVTLAGELRGNRAAGFDGASLQVDSRSAIALDDLATRAAAGGIDGSIALRSGSGNLDLSAGRTLSADRVQLVADGGRVRIDGTIDAAGAEGGDIALYGQRAVEINGQLLAQAATAAADGGRIEIGVGTGNSSATDADHGYRAVGADQAGRIDIAAGAVLDVSGEDGEIKLRAPVLDDHRVPVTVAAGATIRGDADPELEIYARWDAADTSTGARHFSGVIDPSGVAGGGGTGDNARFITETLMDYVRSPGWQIDSTLGQAAGWQRRAGIDLSNSGGDIDVASDWNLAAGHLGADGNPVLDFRTDGLAPTISLRAAGDVRIGASISDGFYQTVNPFNPAAAASDVDNSLAPVASGSNPLPLATASLLGTQGGKAYDSASLRIVAGADTGSADPLALAANRAPNKGNVILSGHQTASSNAPGNEGRQIVTPTMVRTGIGSIDVVAARDILITDTQAPGVIYTAGHAGIEGVVRPSQTALQAAAGGQAPVLDTGNVQPRDAGDLRLSAGRDIVAVTTVTDSDGSRTGAAGTDLSQAWWPWMQSSCFTTAVGCGARPDSSSINFGMFAQGLLSMGGDVSIQAGRDVNSLSVSMPTTWTRAGGQREDSIGGGGELEVTAGGDIRGGSYFVSSGGGELRALGVIADSVIALQDAKIGAEAAQGISIGGVFNPSYLFTNFDANAYSAASAVRLVTAAGDARLGTAAVLPGSRYGSVPGVSRSLVQDGAFYVLPAHLSVAAASGNLILSRGGELFPSADGQLELLAQRNITLQGRSNSGERLGLIDALASLLPSIDNPLPPAALPATGSYIDQGPQSNFLLRDPALLHAHDTEPVRIYSVAGSLLNGYRATDAAVAADPDGVPQYVGSGSGLRLLLDKPASIRAGLDIVNLYFSGQNFYDSDITTIAAGRDLLDPALQRTRFVPLIELGGPGTLAVSAGRNIGPITSAGDARDAGYLFKGSEQFPGIRTVGNSNNLYLDRSGADISVSYGIGPGMKLEAFAETYINPAVNHDPLNEKDLLGTPDYSGALLAFVRQQLLDAQRRDGQDRSAQIAALNPAAAWTVFKGLALEQRQKFVGTVFLDILNQVGLDYNAVTRRVVDRNHPQGVEYNADNILYAGQYRRGYQAIENLFPASLGYTQNALDGSRNGALVTRSTGTLDMRGSTVQTRFGGDIDILGPGGPLLIGSTSAPPFTAETGNTAAVGPSSQGILALQEGAVRLFIDQSVLLAQSRVFTQQGGDLLMWSSNGDINAGKGAKTSSSIPPLAFSCDDNLFCTVDTQSQVSGAGIAALQSKPGLPAGNANLVAPAGTVDAGDAGIRVSGNLNVAAQQVANADNIQTDSGSFSGQAPAADAGTAAAANAAAAAVAASAEQATGGRKRDGELELFVEILTPAASSECEAGKPGKDCL